MKINRKIRRALKISSGKMYLYVYAEKNNPTYSKVGETWVKTGMNPKAAVYARIKQQLTTRAKTLFPNLEIEFYNIHNYLLVECPHRAKQRGHGDDYIRDQIGYKGADRETVSLSFEETNDRIIDILAASKAEKPVVGLAPWQFYTAKQILEAIDEGKRTFIVDLCPRFGKTIWSAALAIELKIPLTIVASYVLTSFRSFKNDLKRYEQFRDVLVVDSKDDNYQVKVADALKQGKQVLVFLSMCIGTQRAKRINWLYNRKVQTFTVIDEADYGVHKPAQAKLLAAKSQRNDNITILMTGTNADRAVASWKIDAHLIVTYPDLIMEKYHSQVYKGSSLLRNFKIDLDRCISVVDPEYYQMGLNSVVKLARRNNPDLFVDDGDNLPSWTKFAADPLRAKGFYRYMLEAMFYGKHSLDELNVDHQFTFALDRRVAMMFFPGNTRNDNFTKIADMTKQFLGSGFTVIPIYGETMTNETAEQLVREAVEQSVKLGKNLLLLSCGMASRSFSIPEIDEIYLAYDEGELGATIQKASRVLTPDLKRNNKVGRIISLSFDPNRDDKFDFMIIKTAENFMKKHKMDDLKKALAMVLKTVDIFSCSSNGRIPLNKVKGYLEALQVRNSLPRIIGRMAEIVYLTDEERKTILALANGHTNVVMKQDIAQRGRTRLTKREKRMFSKITKDNEKKIREAITALARDLHIVVDGTNTKTFKEAFTLVRKSKQLQESFRQTFGFDAEIVESFIKRNIINGKLQQLQLH